MKDIGSRQFQLTYQKLTEPVRVLSLSSGNKTIGYFYPGEEPPTAAPRDEFTLDDALGGFDAADEQPEPRKSGIRR